MDYYISLPIPLIMDDMSNLYGQITQRRNYWGKKQAQFLILQSTTKCPSVEITIYTSVQEGINTPFPYILANTIDCHLIWYVPSTYVKNGTSSSFAYSPLLTRLSNFLLYVSHLYFNELK